MGNIPRSRIFCIISVTNIHHIAPLALRVRQSKSRLKSNFPLKMQKHDGARAPHSSSRPSMLTALRIDARATDIHSSAMAIHTYASPSAKPREGDDGGDDSGARRQCAKFTIWNDFGDKENVDPVTATAATTRRRSKDCTPSRPPLADITRRFTPPVRRARETDTMTRGKFKHSIYAPNF